MLPLPTEEIAWWSSRSPLESTPEHYENPEQLLHIFKKLSEDKAVLLGGEGGSGKSTTVTAVVKLLDINKIPHGSLSPKSTDVVSARTLETSTGTLLNWAEKLENYDRPQGHTRPVIVMDSADYLHIPITFPIDGKLRYFSYEDLQNKDEKTLTDIEIAVLENYNARLRIMRALRSGKYKTLGTFHPFWSVDNRERVLYKEFKELFPDDSIYKLVPLSSKQDPSQ